MTFEEIISGFRLLEARNFDLNNIDANGMERLYELTEDLEKLPSADRATTEIFLLIERLPDSDLGSPGPLVHTLEKFPEYQVELVKSVQRRPTVLSVWMLNRLLNSNLSDEVRIVYMALLQGAARHPDANGTTRDDALGFIEYQKQKSVGGA